MFVISNLRLARWDNNQRVVSMHKTHRTYENEKIKAVKSICRIELNEKCSYVMCNYRHAHVSVYH